MFAHKPTATAVNAARPLVGQACARVRGSVLDLAQGTTTLGARSYPVCRFGVVTAGFRFPDELQQLPPSPLPSTMDSMNVYTVNVIGSTHFVTTLRALLAEQVLVEVCGQLHVEGMQKRNGEVVCPSITVSADRLKTTENSLRFLHAPCGDAKEMQISLQRAILNEKGKT